MPFNAALTGGQVTQVRKTNQAFEHYLLVNPNDIVWQAQVDEDKSAENYAEFNWTNTLQGARGNVIVGQVILITTSDTDFSNPVIRGRVRVVPDATDVYINETGTDIANTMYVTVIDDFDIMERLQRVSGGIKFKDWDLTFRDLPPLIDGLQSVYADFSGSNPVGWSFAPTATAMASGAAISTWAWDVGDGTITVGTAASQNITATFPGYSVNEHRWVHLTVTDDNGNASVFHFEVYTVNKQSSTAVKIDSGNLQINATLQEGWNATITAWANFAQDDVLDQTRVAIAGIDDYDGTATPITSNIMMVGRLRLENNQTSADELAGEVAEVDLNIEGFATQLARLPAPAVQVSDATTPASWGEMVSPYPTRAIVYLLAYHTTYLTLSSVSADDLSAYVLGDYSLGETTALDNVNKQLESVNGMAAFAPSGETTLRRNASYQTDADRAGLTTVFDFTTADITPELSMELEYGETVGEIEAGAVVYNTTTNDIDFRYIGRAPASSFGSGHESEQLNGQVLIADSTDGDARDELVQRTADHLAYINPKTRLDIGLMDGFWFAIPTLYQRWTFTLAASDTTRERAYTSSDYWQLLSINYLADNEENTRTLSATFEEETQGENAGISVTLVPDVNDLDYSLPPMGAYDTFPDDGLTNFPVDDPEFDPYYAGGQSAVMETDQNNQEAPANCETFNIPMYGEFSRATTRNTVNAAAYTVRVEGETEFATDWCRKWSFSAGEQGWVAANLAGNDRAIWVADHWTNADAPIQVRDDIFIQFTFAEALNVTEVVVEFTVLGRVNNARVYADEVIKDTQAAVSAETTLTVNSSVTKLWVGGLHIPNDDNALGCELTAVTIKGTGTPPVGGVICSSAPITNGDGFYKWGDEVTAALYGAGLGLLINGAVPGTIGPYQANHDYTIPFTGTGAPLSFKYKLVSYSDAARNVLRITVCGENMGLTT